jgi:hypothetical protein
VCVCVCACVCVCFCVCLCLRLSAWSLIIRSIGFGTPNAISFFIWKNIDIFPGATKGRDLRLEVHRIRSGDSRDRHGDVAWLDFMAPHRHLVDVTLISARTNTNIPRICARLPLPDSLALVAQDGKLCADLRTYALPCLVCGCENRARKFTSQARVMFSESKRVKTHMTEVWVSTASCKQSRAIGFSEGRGPTWPLGAHHVDGGVWNAWVCGCANHTRPTRGTRRELGSEMSRNE